MNNDKDYFGLGDYKSKDENDYSNELENELEKQEIDLSKNDYDLDSFMSERKAEEELQKEEESISLSSFSSQGKNGGDKKRKKKKNAKKRIIQIIIPLFLVGAIVGCFVAGSLLVYAFAFVDDTVYEDLDDMTLDFTTTIYIQDEETDEWVEYQRLHGEENRIWVGLEEMPDYLWQSFVAIEDQHFLEHNGVDWKRTVGAFGNLFFKYWSTNQGGSTITQQLVKNLTGDDDDKAVRKIREIMRARYLEGHYSKETILECYLNTICFAKGIYGVEVASNYYFGKSVNDLTLTEAAALAAMPKSPTKYRPDKNPNDNKSRRSIVLKFMNEQGYITETEYKDALETELSIVATNDAIGEKEINNYFVDAVIDEVIDRLVEEYNMDPSYAAKNFYNAGYKIYATMDPDVQNVLEAEFENTEKYFKEKSSKTKATLQGAMTIVDYQGHIVGIVGGAGEKTENRGLNRATSSPRQPGSTMKPLGAYCQALDDNLITYSTMLEDSALPKYHQDGSSGPRNWYGGYEGYMSVKTALERSNNTIPCKLVKQIGVETSYHFVTSKLGFTSFTNEDKNLSSLALGGSSRGITTTQSAAAYAIFGNGGRYYQPTTFTKVLDQDNDVILSEKSFVTAINSDTATIMNRLLQNVVYGSRGTGTLAAGYNSEMKAYAKTGTSSEANDCWFVGGTPYYVGSCWVGFDVSSKVNASSTAKNLWTNIMKTLHKDLEAIDFAYNTEDVVSRYYCTSSGKLATDACPGKAVGYYKTTYIPGACTDHAGTTLPTLNADGTEKEPPKEETTSSETSSTKPTESSKPSETVSSEQNTTDGDEENTSSKDTQTDE